MFSKLKLLNENNLLIITVTFLTGLGLLMVFSSSAVMASASYHDPFFFLKKQLVWAFLGIIGMFIASRFNYTYLGKLSFFMIIISVILLVLVLVPGIGRTVGGARRWIRLGPIGFQPTEFAKLSLIIYTASWIDRKQSKLLKTPSIYIPKLIIVGVILLLIFIEPDMGNTVLTFVTIVSIHFIGGLRLRYIFSLVLLSLPAIYMAILRSAYRRRRLMSFFNPWADPKGSGYQVIQSLLALGSGGITGVGLGASRLKLLYLPEAHTDFIYPIIGEELGFIGTISVVIAFIIFCWCGVRISLAAKDLFGKLLVYGIIFIISCQAIINIAVVTASMPTKGISLPFISFGGSSLFINLVAVGIILNVARRSKK